MSKVEETSGRSVVHFFEMAPEAFNGKIPFIVSDLINQLKERHAEDVEGVFRLNGSDVRIKELISEIDRGPIENWAKYTDIHDIATTLKRYFREMLTHEPLFPFELFECITAAMKIDVEERQIEILSQIANELLSKTRYTLLAYLLNYLYFLSQNSNQNKMTPKNIAVCFAPNLLCSAEESTNAFEDSLASNKAIELYIEHYPEIFKDFEIKESLICDDQDFARFYAPPMNMVHVQYQIFRCNFRRNHTIPFVSLSRLLKSEMERPTYEPSLIKNNEADREINAYDTLNQLSKRSKSVSEFEF